MQPMGQLSFLSLLSDAQAQPRSGRTVQHTRDADTSTLLRRIEAAAQRTPRVMLDISGELSQYATSVQALDLLLAEHILVHCMNPARIGQGLSPIELSYKLPGSGTAKDTPGLVALAHLGLHKHLNRLSKVQRQHFTQLAHHAPVQPPPPARHHDPVVPDQDGEHEVQDVNEQTLLPVVRINSNTNLDRVIRHTRDRLSELLKQGIPGIDQAYVDQIVVFIEESVSNVLDHAGVAHSLCEGFVSANRTYRYYRDRKRDQWVEEFTTHIACYDTGQGILPSLVNVSNYAKELSQFPQDERRSLAALRMAMHPGITSKAQETGHGGGIPRMVNVVRKIPSASNHEAYTYRAGLRLTSGGAILDVLSTTDQDSFGRFLPGTQIRLWFQAIRRTNI